MIIINFLKKIIFAKKVFGKDLSFTDIVRLSRYLFKRFILCQSIPLAAVFAITYKCQCNCKHCSTKSYANNIKEELTTDEVKKVMRSLSAANIFKVTLFGGEPLLRADLLEIISFARKLGLRISIDTNGYDLSEDLLKTLTDIGISNINISFDSSEADIHDKLRGIPGCFNKALHALDLCVRMHVSCLVSTYASRRSIVTGDLKRLITLARRHKASGVKILFPILSGNWLENEQEKLSLFEEIQVRDLLDPSFVYIEDALSTVRNSSKKCSALEKNFFYISPDGQIQLCPAVPISFGNVKHTELSKILAFMWSHPISSSDCSGCLMNNAGFRNKYLNSFKLKSLPIMADEL